MNTSPNPIYYPPKRSGGKSVLIAIVIVLVVVLLGFAIAMATILGTSGGAGKTVADLPADDYVGVLHIEGTIAAASGTGLLYGDTASYHHDYVLGAIKDMKNDPNNHGILLYIDTPGGEIYATDEVYQALLDYKAETHRPVYAYFATYACSGGYYIGMAADEIYAHRMSTTGSIGVSYGTHIDISGLCEKLGIKAEDITSGDNKAMGSYFAPLTDEQRAIYESQLEEYFGYFVDVVEAGRGMTEDEVKALADGRTYTAKQALEAKLIDGISEYGDYLARVEDILDERIDEDIVFHDIEYTVDYNELLSSVGYIAGQNTELDAILAAFSPLSGVLAYYSGH